MSFVKNYISNQNLNKDELQLIYLLIAIIFLGYLIPTIIFLSPAGTDVYTHMYNTEKMGESNSLLGFYDKSLERESLNYDYPFGLWLFGSIVIKVTGIDMNDLAYILPFILSGILIFIYYIYANYLLNSRSKAIFSTIFLISMPLMAMNILQYATGRFISLLLVPIIYISLYKYDLKKLLLVSILAFSLVFTHTGTYIFLVFFSIAFFIISALIWKKFNSGMYCLILILLFLYVMAVQFFPYIQPQYADKGRLVLSISESISVKSGLDFIKEFGQIFYDKIFIESNIIYVIFFSCIIYVSGKLSIYINSKFESMKRDFLAVPILTNFKNVSHGIITTPFWMGPIHTILSIIGIFKLDQKGKCIMFSLILTSLIPGSLQSDVGTGALREIYYLFLIIPISSTAGFYSIISTINEKYSVHKKKIIYILFLLLLLLPLVSAPIIGNLYYQPTISGTKSEKENLIWLSKIGTPDEGVTDFAYRERIGIYTEKYTPNIHSGSEMRRYLDDLRNTYFSGSIDYIKDLYSFNIKYIISSDRILNAYGEQKESLRIDSNQLIDKIYSSDKNFSIYNYITPPEIPRKSSSDDVGLDFQGNLPIIKDFGSTYLIENDFYKIRLSDISPEIKYLGDKTNNILDQGTFSDLITLTWASSMDIYKGRFVQVSLGDIKYNSISLTNNSITYKTIVKDENNDMNWATLIVKYTFFETNIKRDVIIANDWMNPDHDLRMNVAISSNIFTYATNFEFNQIEQDKQTEKLRKVYPSQDTVNLKDKKINEIYFNNGDAGLLIKYGDLIPYPTRLSYKGSTLYEFGYVSLGSNFGLDPTESLDLQQYFSIGDKLTAKNNMQISGSISKYMYPSAKIPLIITGYSIDTEYLKNISNIFQKYGVMYNTVINQKSNNSPQNSISLVNLIERYNIKDHNNIKDYSGQNEEIRTIKAFNTKGVLIPYSRYNLDSIKILSDNNFLFAEALIVPPPLMEFYREGLRNPKLSYYQGEESDFVLIPVTSPFSNYLNPDSKVDDIFSQWKETMDSVVEDGGMAVFLWNTEDIGNPNYIDKVMNLINYSKNKGMDSVTLDEISTHYKYMKKISANVTKGIDYVVLNSTNHNQGEVTGITYQVEMPLINNSCPYTVSNGRIPRQDIKEGNCRLFVSFDLKPGEEKEIKIEPTIIRKTFDVDLSDLFEGDRSIIIMDNEGNQVDKASIYVDAHLYESNQNGSVNFSIRRGNHTIKVEKPGFVSRDYQIDVKGRVYRVFNIFNNDTRMKKNESDEIVLAKQNGSDQNATQGSWINKLSNLIYNNT